MRAPLQILRRAPRRRRPARPSRDAALVLLAPVDMLVALSALVDVIHAVAMIVWIVGLPLLFVDRSPRLRRAYAVYAIVFVVLSQSTQMLLGECFLTTLARALARCAGGEVPPAWFTERLAQIVFGLAPSRKAIRVAFAALVGVNAVGVLVHLARSRRGRAASPVRV